MVSSKKINNGVKPSINRLGWQQRAKVLPRRFWNSLREHNRLAGLVGMLVIAIPFIGSYYSFHEHTPAGTTFWQLALDPSGLPGTLFFVLLFIACTILFLSRPLEGGTYHRRLHYPSYRDRSSKRS